MKNATDRSWFSQFFFMNRASAPVWFLIRLYVGYEWLVAGWEKVSSSAWVGGSAGAPLKGFVMGALAKTAGAHPDVPGWYASFLHTAVLPNVVVWSNVVAVGELLVGIGLIVGLFTGVAAFFGFFMNMNYMLAGTVSSNPTLLLLSLFILFGRRVAGYWGLDRYRHEGLRMHRILRLFKAS